MLRRLKETADKARRKSRGGGSSDDVSSPGGAAAAAAAAEDLRPTPKPTARVSRPKPSSVPDEELIGELPDGMYLEDYGATRETVLELPDKSEDVRKDLAEVDARRKRKFLALQAVSRKLSKLVLEHSKEFMEELMRVSELQNQLEFAKIICKHERRRLDKAQRGVRQGLSIVDRHVKKSKLLALLKLVQSIAVLKHAKATLTELLEHDDYLSAIELWRECTDKARLYRRFACVEDLSIEFHDTKSLIEDYLHSALQRLCLEFSLDEYRRVVRAYVLLGQEREELENLASHFSAVALKVARQAILDHVPNPKKHKATATLKSLCQSLPSAKFEPVIRQMAQQMCRLMANYRAMEEHHSREEEEEEEEEEGDEEGGDGDGEGADGVSNGTFQAQSEVGSECPSPGPDSTNAREQQSSETLDVETAKPGRHQGTISGYSWTEYTALRLEHGRRKLWEDMQRHVGVCLGAMDLSAFKLDEFVKILGFVSKLSQIGGNFAGHGSVSLEKTVRLRTKNYVLEYHRRTILSLHERLCGETWVACDVEKGFNMFNMKEFAFLRRRTARSSRTPSTSDLLNDGTEVGPVELTLDFFNKNPTMFDAPPPATASESSSASGTRPASRRSSTPATPRAGTPQRQNSTGSGGTPAKTEGKAPPPPPHCTVTALHIVGCFGRYLQLMDVLRPIATSIFACMTELFDFFLHTAFKLFAADSTYPRMVLSPMTRGLLERLRRLIEVYEPPGEGEKEDAVPPAPSGDEATPMRSPFRDCPPVVLSDTVVLNNPSNLHGLAARIAGVESLSFLSTVLRSMVNNIKRRLGKNLKPLSIFFSGTADLIVEVQWYLYKNAVAKVLDTSKLVGLMSGVKWDIKEVTTDYSKYVDTTVSDCKVLAGRLDILGPSRVPEGAHKTVWNEVCVQLNKVFTDGFASAKKCSPQGRALMQLDYTQCLSKIGSIAKIKPPSEHVNDFVKAYYLEEKELEGWLETHHKPYTIFQLRGLVSSNPAFNRKSKQRLTKKVDELKGIAPPAASSDA